WISAQRKLAASSRGSEPMDLECSESVIKFLAGFATGQSSILKRRARPSLMRDTLLRKRQGKRTKKGGKNCRGGFSDPASLRPRSALRGGRSRIASCSKCLIRVT